MRTSMNPQLVDKLILDYASRRRRRPLAATIDLELWAVVGVAVALLVGDLGCIVLILLNS
jgi:hypothetical protein